MFQAWAPCRAEIRKLSIKRGLFLQKTNPISVFRLVYNWTPAILPYFTTYAPQWESKNPNELYIPNSGEAAKQRTRSESTSSVSPRVSSVDLGTQQEQETLGGERETKEEVPVSFCRVLLS